MAAQKTLQGNWNEIKRKLQEKWNELTDDDLGAVQSNMEQLVGRIQKKTGESRQAVERYLDQLAQDGQSVVGKAQEGVHQAAEIVRDAAGQMSEKVSNTYAAAEDIVLQRPGQSVLVVFVSGVVAGLGISMLLRDRRPDSSWTRSKEAADQFGRQLMHALSAVPESVLSKLHR